MPHGMKKFSSEYRVDYGTYTFGYANYCQYEPGDKWSDIYAEGYLPYTGNYQIKDSIFYMARSLRIDLSRFDLSSENRRVNRKMDDLDSTLKVVRKEDFRFDHEFMEFASHYAQERFKGGEMSEERLNYLISRLELTTVLVYSDQTEGKPIAYVLCCIDERMVHYWFSFLDLGLLKEKPLGKWVMLDAISQAKEWGKSYVYLGTCYGTKSLYKVRDFKGVEFFTGGGWCDDVAIIKEWCKTDDQNKEIDRYKLENKPK